MLCKEVANRNRLHVEFRNLLKARCAPKHCTSLLLRRCLVTVEALIALALENRSKKSIVDRCIHFLEANDVSVVCQNLVD